jgi:hypothetical protein
MARRLHLQPHLSIAELEHRYRAAKEPNERTWWQILWLLAQGRTATELSAVIGYRAYWIGQIAKRSNEQGPAGMQNRRHTASYRPPPVLAPTLQEELRGVLAAAAARDERWTLDGPRWGRLEGPAAGAAHLLPSGVELPRAPQAELAGAPAAPRPGGRRAARDL